MSFYGAEFRRDFVTCAIRRGADSSCMRLVKFSGEVLLEILSLLNFLRLSSKFRASRISTLKFYGRRCKQDKI